jgi:F0F1-type ATP synthase assembly protein I
MEESKRKTNDISIWEAMGIVWDIVATVLILTTLFALGGIMMDRWLGTPYIFTAIGFILLIVLGYRIILKKGRRVAKRLDEHSEKPPSANTDT